MPDSESEATHEGPEEQALCTNCLHPIEQTWDFCPDCNAPLGPAVGLDPINRIYTTRFIFHKLAGGSTPNYFIVAVWLFFTPFLLLAISKFINAAFTQPIDWWSSIQGILGVGFCSYVLWAVTTSYLEGNDDDQ